MSRGNQGERSVTLEFDGASSGNPGRSGAGAVLRDGNQVQRFSQGLGTQTNNSAEYQGLILGLKEAANQGYDRVHVRGDSQLVCNQFEGSWKVNNQNLRGLCNEAQQLKSNFKSVTVEHVPRGHNTEADAQASRGKYLGAGQVEGDYYYK
ncbi:uncharacterized protein Mb2253c-like [Trifolium pratense]|uniref:Uncharacterized protein n=1 Tax=Trifolium pratense TaxID=57577 RepID=A0ACB0LV21_TRIPR|nr:uncharacterized protein Mb2253c-like [Trifolium pratense]CAJ2672282.1 unnamed protein product [Trifolium pratense]